MRMESFLIGVLATLFACACLNAEDETGYQFGKDKLMYACPSNSSSAERTQQPIKSDDFGKGGQRIQTEALPIGKEVTIYRRPFLGLVAELGGQTKRLSWENAGEYLTKIHDAKQMESLLLLFHDDLKETRIGIAGISDIYSQVRSLKESRPFTIVDEQIEKTTIGRFILDRDGMWLAHFLRVENASVIEYKYVVSDKHKVARLRRAIIRGPENPSGNGEFQAPDEWPAEKQQRWKEFRRCRDYLMSQTIKNKKTEKGN